MKKKVIAVALYIALLMTSLIPATALAEGGAGGRRRYAHGDPRLHLRCKVQRGEGKFRVPRVFGGGRSPGRGLPGR